MCRRQRYLPGWLDSFRGWMLTEALARWAIEIEIQSQQEYRFELPLQSSFSKKPEKPLVGGALSRIHRLSRQGDPSLGHRSNGGARSLG